MTFAERRLEPELMDQPGLDESLHIEALQGLAAVNKISRNAAALWKRIQPLAAKKSGEPFRILDIACGGGDTAIALAQRARRGGLSVEVAGCDISETAMAHARNSAQQANVPVEFFNADVVNAPLPEKYDVICCSLFLHHLTEDQAVGLLRNMKQAARQLVLVSDLSRNRLGYLLAWCGVRILTRSPVCRVDGPLSVSAAFTPSEARQLADKAGLTGATLSYQWPQRYLLQWRVA